MQRYQHINYAVSAGVARLTINRPDRLNAICIQTVKELIDAVAEAEGDHAVGVIVLTGAGDKAFCAGGDLNQDLNFDDPEALDIGIDRSVINCLKPTIARVNGYAIASGNHLAYHCDFTIAAEHAIFGQNGPRVGAPAAGHFVSYSAQILGHKRAREMWMLCRRYTAAEMLNWGLVNAVVPYAELDAEVGRWCDELLAMSPTTLKFVKRSFNRLVDLTTQNPIINEISPEYMRSGEMQEGVRAFLEKRKPDFSKWR